MFNCSLSTQHEQDSNVYYIFILSRECQTIMWSAYIEHALCYTLLQALKAVYKAIDTLVQFATGSNLCKELNFKSILNPVSQINLMYISCSTHMIRLLRKATTANKLITTITTSTVILYQSDVPGLSRYKIFTGLEWRLNSSSCRRLDHICKRQLSNEDCKKQYFRCMDQRETTIHSQSIQQ